MGTVLRAELSEKNKYHIPKHRHYELKHFCLQYNEWKKAYAAYNEALVFVTNYEEPVSSSTPSDLTAKYAIKKAQYAGYIKMVEKAAKEADAYLYNYIIKAVTEGLSYPTLKVKYDIPCGKDMFYDRYRKFFWLLSESRG